jgi:hypothetical protein
VGALHDRECGRTWGALALAGASALQIGHHVAEERARAAAELEPFLDATGLVAAERLLRLENGSPPFAILDIARATGRT